MRQWLMHNGFRLAAVLGACVLAGVLAGGLWAAEDEQPSEAPAQPRVEFAEESFDFGTIYQNEEVTHFFRFRNRGDATLRIDAVKSSCGCTAAMPEARELAPGGESSIKVTFRSGAMRDRVTKHVYVDSNDPVEPRVTLTVEGQIKVELDVNPRGVYFGQAVVGEKVERMIELTPVDTTDFKITGVSSDNPAVQVGKPQPLGDKKPGYKLTITVGPPAKPGRLSAKVTVSTNLPHTKQLQISVYGKFTAQSAGTSAPPQ